MGMDPLTIGLGLSAAGGLYGAFNQNKTNTQNYNAQQSAAAAQTARQGQIDKYVQPFLSQGQNPFASQLMQMLNGGVGGFKSPTPQTPFTYNPASYNPSMVQPGTAATGTQGFNAGQDSYMQLLKSGGSPFDTSSMFSALAPLDQRAIDQQVAQLQGSQGSLGSRFGTATADRESNLRRDFLQNITARNAGIQQQSYEAAQGRVANAAGGLQSGGLQQMSLLAQIAQANAGAQNQAGQFNAGSANQAGQFNAGQEMQTGQFNQAAQQTWNSFMSQILGQAGGLQAQQQGQNAQLLSIMAGLQPPGVPQQQPSALPGGLGDIGQLLMFLPFLRGMGGGGAGNRAPVNSPYLPANAGPYYVPGASF